MLLVVDALEQVLLLRGADPVRIGPVAVGDDDAEASLAPSVPVPGLMREPEEAAGSADSVACSVQRRDYPEEDVPSLGLFSDSGRPGSGSSKCGSVAAALLAIASRSAAAFPRMSTAASDFCNLSFSLWFSVLRRLSSSVSRELIHLLLSPWPG